MDERGGPVRVSVVVATHERAPLLDRLVAALAAQDVGEPFEVVVVDDGSTDSTWATLERLASTRPWLRPVRLPANAGPARARNVGWRAAVGEVIAFTDDDCVQDPGWLRALVAAAAAHGVAQGRTQPDPDQWARRGPFSRTLRVDGPGFFQTANIAYRRDVLESTGGFDEQLRDAGEDTDLGLRARDRGVEVAWVEDALVHHDVSPSSFLAHLRGLRRWTYLPLVVARHPQARGLMHSRVWWKWTHPPTVAGLAAAAALAVAWRRRLPVVALAALPLGLPYARARLVADPPVPSRLRSLWYLPGRFALDVAEVAAVARGSIRYRVLVL